MEETFKIQLVDEIGALNMHPDSNVPHRHDYEELIIGIEGQYTAVTGYIEGTFSEPMPLPNGGSIPATGKSFKLPMVTIGLWKDGTMYEEHLFWDNQAFMKQIGLAN